MRFLNAMTTCVLIAFASIASAHSHLASSEPKANEVLSVAPESITIHFKDALRPKESIITVFDSAKKQVNNEDATVGEDKKTLTVALPELTAGSYTVKWKAVCFCADHGVTSGTYKFTVK